MHEDKKVSLKLGRPFLATGGAMIDVQKGELTLRLHNESITFNIYDALKFHGKEGVEGYQECNVIQVVMNYVGEVEVTYHQTQDPLESCLINSFTPTTTDLSTCETMSALEEEEEGKIALGKPQGPPKVELKSLPEHLRYAFLRKDNTYPIVVSAALSEKEYEKLYVL